MLHKVTRNPIRWYPERGYDRLSGGATSELGNLRKQFGLRVRQIRDESDRTQEEFAEILGISVDFLSLIERGRNAPSFKRLERMARGISKPVAYLFAFDPHYKPRKRMPRR